MVSAMKNNEFNKSIPLVIDLDGTLIHSDLLIESALSFVGSKPLKALSPFLWLISGKAYLKERLAKSTELDITTLPYNSQLLSFINDERAKGRKIILATASHRIYAEKVAEHLKLFDQVMATEDNNNLSASNKRDKLIGEFGEQGFDYIGNSHDDLPVWSVARYSYIANPDLGVVRKANEVANVGRVFNSESRNVLKIWVKALRFHQWTKNLLIFVPLLASHQLTQTGQLFNGLLAFLFFGFCASSVYLLNDLLDLRSDRHHKSKCNRPFASGALSIKSGLIAIPVLLLIAFYGALIMLPWQYSVALLLYYLLTTAYSFSFKKMMIVDVITLSLLYTFRIIAGTYAFGVNLTFWMLAFSMFMFLSLALVKRYAELRELKKQGKSEKTKGRGYYPDDLEMLSSLGAASGYLSVMVLALYTQEKSTILLYNHPQIIWLACPLLLFWISRVWLLTHRGHMHDDPIIFAIKDKVSLIVGALFSFIFWLAI